MVQPDITTALGCEELAGTTPGCMASRSVKLRPFSGTAVIFFTVIRSPDCVEVESTGAHAGGDFDRLGLRCHSERHIGTEHRAGFDARCRPRHRA